MKLFKNEATQYRVNYFLFAVVMQIINLVIGEILIKAGYYPYWLQAFSMMIFGFLSYVAVKHLTMTFWRTQITPDGRLCYDKDHWWHKFMTNVYGKEIITEKIRQCKYYWLSAPFDFLVLVALALICFIFYGMGKGLIGISEDVVRGEPVTLFIVSALLKVLGVITVSACIVFIGKGIISCADWLAKRYKLAKIILEWLPFLMILALIFGFLIFIPISIIIIETGMPLSGAIHVYWMWVLRYVIIIGGSIFLFVYLGGAQGLIKLFRKTALYRLFYRFYDSNCPVVETCIYRSEK